jgi:hypothetical protein
VGVYNDIMLRIVVLARILCGFAILTCFAHV